MAKRRSKSPYRVAHSQRVLVKFLHDISAEFGWDASHFFDSRGIPTGFGLDDLPETDDPRDFFVEYLRRQLMSKFDDGKSSQAKVDAAFVKFHEAELLCIESSIRLRDRGVNILPFTSADAVLHRACLKISRLLGEFDWGEASEGFGFGPGATARLPRHRATLPNKLSGYPVATDNMRSIVEALCALYPAWDSDSELSSTTYIVGNRITTVPKNYKTDRTIAAEPDLNALVQRGIGRIIRRRLKAKGVDLDDQSRNRYLARKGSIDGSLATIDLSMASDTVSWALVDHLLPPDWATAIEQTRSPAGVLPDGTVVTYQKVSSMGNGYTFELESLIFWALATVVVEILELEDRTVGVYGDDIIVPTAAAAPLLEVLAFLGFKPNQKKSHISGSFRESCGGHYFRGHDVTPFFIRSPLKEFTDVFLLHNNVYRWSARCISGYRWSGPNGGIPELCNNLRSAVGGSKWGHLRICDGVGDGAFVGSFDEAMPVPERSEDYQRTRFRFPILGRRSPRSSAGLNRPAVLRAALFSRDTRTCLRDARGPGSDLLLSDTRAFCGWIQLVRSGDVKTLGSIEPYRSGMGADSFQLSDPTLGATSGLSGHRGRGSNVPALRAHRGIGPNPACSPLQASAVHLTLTWLKAFTPIQPIDTRLENPHEVPITRMSILVDRWVDVGPWL